MDVTDHPETEAMLDARQAAARVVACAVRGFPFTVAPGDAEVPFQVSYQYRPVHDSFDREFISFAPRWVLHRDWEADKLYSALAPILLDVVPSDWLEPVYKTLVKRWSVELEALWDDIQTVATWLVEPAEPTAVTPDRVGGKTVATWLVGGKTVATWLVEPAEPTAVSMVQVLQLDGVAEAMLQRINAL